MVGVLTGHLQCGYITSEHKHKASLQNKFILQEVEEVDKVRVQPTALLYIWGR
jgi:hypothetical protein